MPTSGPTSGFLATDGLVVVDECCKNTVTDEGGEVAPLYGVSPELLQVERRSATESVTKIVIGFLISYLNTLLFCVSMITTTPEQNRRVNLIFF